LCNPRENPKKELKSGSVTWEERQRSSKTGAFNADAGGVGSLPRS